MATIKNTIILSAAMLLSACVNLSTENSSADDGRMNYTIEQNTLGEFVFCKNDECPEMTRKEMDEPVYAPTVRPYSDQSVRVFFSLGSARLGEGTVQTLKSVLPKLKNTNNMIYVRGWADSIGGRKTAINQRLSKQRAAAIKTWLVKHGLDQQIRTASSPACCNKDDTRSVVITW